MSWVTPPSWTSMSWTAVTLEVRDLTTIGLLADDATSEDRLLDWSQETRVATSLTLIAPEPYVVASSDGIGAGNRVRAILADQYGAGVGRNRIITFTSADPSVRPNNHDRRTHVGGVATFSYHRDSDSGTIETITARSGDLEATTHQYWPAPLPDNTTTTGQVAIIDPSNNHAIITTNNDVWLIAYTPTDHLIIGQTRVRLPTFRDALKKGTPLTAQTTQDAHPNTYTLHPTP